MLLGVFVHIHEYSVSIKMTGPQAFVNGQKNNFKTFLSSLQIKH